MLQSIVLGIVQGLTEFLPVSSSGHLVMVPALLGWEKPSLTFDLLVHVATLVAVLVALRREIATLVLGVAGRGVDPRGARRLVAAIGAGTVPAAVTGVALGGLFEELFERPGVVCVTWVLTAAALLYAERLVRDRATRLDPTPGAPATERPFPAVGTRDAVVVGVAQAAAITPGISRAGATIATGMALGQDRAEAARFSFLLSIPIILGAAATRLPDITGGEFALTAEVWAGVVAAGVSGWIAVETLLRYLKTSSLRIFAIYLLVAAPVSAIVLALQ